MSVGREPEHLAMVKVVSREVDAGDPDELTQSTPYKWRLREGVARTQGTSGIVETGRACWSAKPTSQ